MHAGCGMLVKHYAWSWGRPVDSSNTKPSGAPLAAAEVEGSSEWPGGAGSAASGAPNSLGCQLL